MKYLYKVRIVSAGVLYKDENLMTRGVEFGASYFWPVGFLERPPQQSQPVTAVI